MSEYKYNMRSAEFSDARAIFDLIKTFPEQLISRPVSDIIQNIDRFLVCEDEKGITGAISWQILPEMGVFSNPSVEIKSMCVRSDVQRAGIGRILIDEAINKIKLLHPSQIIVLTFVPEFFRKFGFDNIDKVKLMHKLYTGCINCTKYDSPFTCPEEAMALNFDTGGAK